MTEALDPVEDNPEFKNGVGAEQKPAVPCESGLKLYFWSAFIKLFPLRPTPAFLLWTVRCLNGCAIFIQIEGCWNSPVFGKSTFWTRPKGFRLLLTAVTHTLPIYGRTYSQLHSSLSCKKVFLKLFSTKERLFDFRCKENTDFALNCALLLGSVDESISNSRRHLAKKLRNAIIDRERKGLNLKLL